MPSANNVPGIEWIKEKIMISDYNISEHIIRYFLAKKITIPEIQEAIVSGRIIEIHTHREKEVSVLVFGYSGEKPIHVMCAEDQYGGLLILFAYTPSEPMWKNPENRIKQGEDVYNKNVNQCFFCGGIVKQFKEGSFDYRLEGKLYVVKDIPSGLCVQCGEKYITAKASKKVNDMIEKGKFYGTEEVFVLKYE